MREEIIEWEENHRELKKVGEENRERGKESQDGVRWGIAGILCGAQS